MNIVARWFLFAPSIGEKIKCSANTLGYVAATLEVVKKSNGPEIFERNREKLFPEQRGSPLKKKAKTETAFKGNTLTEMIEDARKNESLSTEKSKEQKQKTTREVILEAELDLVNRDLKSAQEQIQYKNRCYTVGELSGYVVRIETGLPTKEVFQIVVRYGLRFKDSIIYFAGWTVESISFEDQIFITLMKVKQNYNKPAFGSAI